MSLNAGCSQELIGSELVAEDESFADIVVQFVDGLSRRLDTMEDAIRASDFEALRTAAHQLKGSGGGYGYPILTERAAELEKGAKAKLLGDCAQQIEELRQLAARIVVSAD
ncbi:MAG: Hpt domain-containing protein [Phycisphaerales bacterium]|nr:MAG: Hpt domain-containing protein [Phycisphaerales bacterium]